MRSSWPAVGEGLKSRPVAAEDVALRDAQRKVGELSMEVDNPQCVVGAQGGPSVAEALEVSEQLPAPLKAVCRVAGVSRSAACEARRRRGTSEPPRRRPGPVGAMSDTELLAEIRGVLADSPFVGEGHRKVWARLRRQRGVYTSRKRVLRLTREAGLLAPTAQVRKRASRLHDGKITVEVPDTLWATDATVLVAASAAPRCPAAGAPRTPPNGTRPPPDTPPGGVRAAARSLRAPRRLRVAPLLQQRLEDVDFHPENPCLQVGDRAMGAGQVGLLADSCALSSGAVVKASLAQSVVAPPTVGVDDRPGRRRGFHEGAQGGQCGVREGQQAQATRAPPASLDGDPDERL